MVPLTLVLHLAVDGDPLLSRVQSLTVGWTKCVRQMIETCLPLVISPDHGKVVVVVLASAQSPGIWSFVELRRIPQKSIADSHSVELKCNAE